MLENSGLGEGDSVYLLNNPLDDDSINVHIPTLEERGVEVFSNDPTVDIPDNYLRNAVRRALGKNFDEVITRDEIGALTVLSISGGQSGLADLTGLEFATGLLSLNLANNQITDLSPLSDLTNLSRLDLANNKIVDLSPLSGLTNLGQLNISNNEIVDMTPLSGLTKLRWLYLANNQIMDLTPLSGLTGLINLNLNNNRIMDLSWLSDMTGLELLYLANNEIVDVSSLSDLTMLTRLELANNEIADVSTLLENSGLDKGDLVDLLHNPLNDDSINVHSVTLKERGVKVSVSGDVVDIPDVNLRAEVEYRLRKEPGEEITTDEMATLTRLDESGSGISDLTGLEFATGLLWVSLPNNEIVDISPLSGLFELSWLILNNNQIKDVSPIASMVGLSGCILQTTRSWTCRH